MTTTTRPHRLGDVITALDMFSGVGGSSMGIHAAGADVVAAANHSEHAINVHAANFPTVEHFRADLINEDADCYIHLTTCHRPASSGPRRPANTTRPPTPRRSTPTVPPSSTTRTTIPKKRSATATRNGPESP